MSPCCIVPEAINLFHTYVRQQQKNRIGKRSWIQPLAAHITGIKRLARPDGRNRVCRRLPSLPSPLSPGKDFSLICLHKQVSLHKQGQAFSWCVCCKKKSQQTCKVRKGLFILYGSVLPTGGGLAQMPALYDGWFSTVREYMSSDGEVVRKVGLSWLHWSCKPQSA